VNRLSKNKSIFAIGKDSKKFVVFQMNKLFYILFVFQAAFLCGQESTITFPPHLLKTEIVNLKNGDSLTYYQCHVDHAAQQLVKENGEVISGKIKQISITEKFILKNENGKYRVKYFTSTYSNMPNRKFAYLKLVEKKYWDFKLVKDAYLNEHDVLMFAAIENKSHETTEYDFPINKYNTNALIITNKKVMKHVVVEGNYLLKKNLEGLN
jgi:hypothetical protein